MKEQAIVIFIPKDKKVDAVRKKHDKYYKEFKNHVTLSYPFKIKNQKALDTHIKNSIKDIKSFNLILMGLKKSKKDYYLYLLVNKGNKNILRLYKNLHLKLLTKFKNKDMPKYIPHLTLGSFNNKLEIGQAIRDINKKNLVLETKVNEICLLTFKKGAQIEKIKRFKLK